MMLIMNFVQVFRFFENLILESQIKKIIKSRILVEYNLKFEKIKSLQKTGEDSN